MEGVLVGCDRNQEWLLSWWWEHYRKKNDYPVAFVDFGLSKEGLLWCKERGPVISLDQEPLLQEVSQATKKAWETRAGPIWPFRSAWFKKPFAFLRTPFEYSCWIDLDCEVKGSIEAVFHALSLRADIALVPEPENVQQNDLAQNLILPGEITYNSGVVSFRKDAPILSLWAALSLKKNHHFMSDQSALSRVIFQTSPPMTTLPAIYNWKRDQPPNPHAVIVHYVAGSKIEILQSLWAKDQ